MVPRQTVVSLLFLLALGSGACGDLATSPLDTSSELARARSAWNRSGIVSYRFTLVRYCECLPETTVPIVVEVIDGQVPLRTYLTSGSPVDSRFDPIFPTIPGLHDVIRDAIDRQAVAISVRYDEHGVPLSIGIDYQAGVVDDEVTYRISDFERLK